MELIINTLKKERTTVLKYIFLIVVALTFYLVWRKDKQDSPKKRIQITETINKAENGTIQNREITHGSLDS